MHVENRQSSPKVPRERHKRDTQRERERKRNWGFGILTRWMHSQSLEADEYARTPVEYGIRSTHEERKNRRLIVRGTE